MVKKVKLDITLQRNVSSIVKAELNRYIKTGHKAVSPPLLITPPADLSDKSLDSHVKSSSQAVKTDASKIAAVKKTIAAQKGIIDKTDNYLSKQNGYKTRKAAYGHVTGQITTLEKKLAKAKTAKDKKSIQGQIASKKKDQKAAFSDIRKVTSSKTYQAQLTKQSKARSKLKGAKNKLDSLNLKKSQDKKKAADYKKEQNKRKAAARRKKQAENQDKINKKIADQKKQPLVGHTALYRADRMSTVVYFFGEVQPTETDTSEVTSIGVDNADPRAGKSTRTSKELTGTYWIFGKNPAAVYKQFADLQKLQRLDTEFIIRGFSNWNHVKISSIAKTVSGLARENALELSITFTYVKQANILYAKKKKKTKKKGATKSTKKKGSDKGKYRSHTVKSGDTYWGLARKYHTTVATLTKLNGSRFKTMFPGHKLKIPK